MKSVLKEYFLEHQKFTKLLASFGVILLGILFLLLAVILRQNDLPIGDNPYYHLSISKTNELGIGAGWNFLLKNFQMEYLLIAMGLLTVILLALNFKSVLFFEERIVAICIFILSPAFIYFFNVGERFGAAFLFSLLTGYFLIDKKIILAIPSLLLIFLFDINIGIFTLFLTLLYYLYTYKKRKLFYFLILASLLFVILSKNPYQGFVSDFGSGIGSSIFTLLFVVFCFFIFWNKKNFLKIYGVALLFLFFSLKFEFGIFYFSIILSLLSSLCFFELVRMKWDSKLTRDLILLVILCGILFSGLSYLNRLSSEKPNVEIFKSLEKLPDNAVVFSDLEYGNWITYSGKINIWNSMMNKDEILKIQDDLSYIFNNRDYSETLLILQKYEVDYVLIDADLRDKWQGSGLIYLLRYNNENFKFLFEENGVEVWRFYR